ncbi:MAG: hypothetical protein IGR93_09390 [Hydrococcus sp. C42_A2020_068]|nr:hypothetical protein [Hydrococcus sp. C42_A2020_068]
MGYFNMALKDLSVEDKVKIAIDSIISEVFGKSSAEIAQKYSGVSAKAVTTLKLQALEAIRNTFSGTTQAPVSAGISDEKISAGIDRLLSSSALPEEVKEEQVQPEESISIEEAVNAIMTYNKQAAKENGQLIYISRAVIQEIAPHPERELDEYLKTHREAIDDHNSKHGLKRNSNRALKGQDWQDWLEF